MTYDDLLREWQAASPSMLCHTSGSTGTPKDILIPKEQMLRSAARTNAFFGIDGSSHLYSAISPDFIGGKMMLVRSLEAGCSFGYEPPTNTPLSNYRGPEISLVSVVPSQMLHILDNLDAIPPVRAFLVGGAPVSNALRQRIADAGINVYESYGMTETSSHIAVRRVGTEPTPFTTLGDITVSSHEGCLKIHIPGWQDLVTNDLATILSPTTFIVNGRRDNMIISGGIKISPEEIENALSPFIATPFYISSVPHPKWGEAVTLVMLGNDTVAPLGETELQQIFVRHLPSVKRPKQIVYRPEFEYTASGKIRRIKPS